jgi:hypothetical protein
VLFNLVNGCKNKDYVDGNASMVWKRLMKKIEPSSAPSLVNLEENSVSVHQRSDKIQTFGLLSLKITKQDLKS